MRKLGLSPTVAVLVTVILAVLSCDYEVRVSPGARASSGQEDVGQLSTVAIPFESDNSAITGIQATVLEFGEEKPLEARIKRIDGVLVASFQVPYGENVRPRLYFTNSSEVVVEVFKTQFTPDRIWYTALPQQFDAGDEIPLHHRLPPEVQLEMGEMSVPLGQPESYVVGDEFLDLRVVGFLPGNGIGETLVVQTSAQESCVTSWTSVQNMAIPLLDDQIVELEAGADLCIGVEAEPETSAVELRVSHF